MPTPPTPEPPPIPDESRPARRLVFLFALLLVGLLYAGTFSTPWVYDDLDGIRDNPALRSGTSLAAILGDNPPDSTPYGRPLVALSLALNHAYGGLHPVGYRAVNLAAHMGAALFLAALLRQVLNPRRVTSPASPAPLLPRCHAERIAFWSALLFAAHPLATTVVTYTVQRAEGLMALFYLGTLAAASRAFSAPELRRWPALSVALCACGMATKETMLTAPLAVLLLHRAAFAGSWREVATRWRVHLGLATTWSILAACMLTWPRRRSVGFGFEDMGVGDYLNLQSGAWWHYLSLLVAPWRLAIDHWPAPTEPLLSVLRGGLFAALFLGMLVWTWRRSRPAGAGLFLAGLVLVPTSTVVPIATSPVADHRMYLAAAFALPLAVVGLFELARLRLRLVTPILGLCALALAVATFRANTVYRSEVAVWRNAVSLEPANARAQNNVGLALANSGDPAEGEKHIREALRLREGYADAWYNLGTLQGRDGRLASAEESLRRALALRPDHAASHCNLAVALARRGKRDAAVHHYEEALRLRPGYPAANFNLAVLHLEAGDFARALPLAEACIRADPDYPQARRLREDLAERTRP